MANSLLTIRSELKSHPFETGTVAIEPEEWRRNHWTKVLTNILVVMIRNRNQHRRPTYFSPGKLESVRGMTAAEVTAWERQ
jgi:hypothetical protein